MYSKRPLIVLRTDADVSALTNAVRAVVCPETKDGIVLVEASTNRHTRLQGLLNQWADDNDLPAGEAKHCHQKLPSDLSRIGFRFRVEVVRKVTPAVLHEQATQNCADLIITGRAKNFGGRLMRYLREDNQLIAESRVPVWLCGTCAEDDAPIVAAVDLDASTPKAIASNFRVVREAFSLAKRSLPLSPIRVIAVCDNDPRYISPALRQSRSRAMSKIQAEILKNWVGCVNSRKHKVPGMPSMPVRIASQIAPPTLISEVLDAINPCVVVTGRPLRSSLSRFLSPGMLSTFVEGPHSVLTVGDASQVDERPRPSEDDDLLSIVFPNPYGS